MKNNKTHCHCLRAGALFKLCDPDIAAAIAALSTPQKIGRFRRQKTAFRGLSFLPCWWTAKFFSRLTRPAAMASGRRKATTTWFSGTFTIFCSIPTARKVGKPTRWAGFIPTPAPSRRFPPYARAGLERNRPGQIFGRAFCDSLAVRRSAASTAFDARLRRPAADHPRRPSRFLDSVARVRSRWKSGPDFDDGGPISSMPQGRIRREAALTNSTLSGRRLLRRTCTWTYHYDAGGHALLPIAVHAQELDALLAGAEFAMGAPAPPQILVTIAARFGRVSWKYSSVAYSLVLKDVGVLIQSLYLMATDMGLGDVRSEPTFNCSRR